MKDLDLFSDFKKLYCGAISDAMDSINLSRSLSGLQPLVEGVKICGRAVTVAAEPTGEPFWPSHLFMAIENAGAGDVLVISTSGADRGCVIGELMSTACKTRSIEAAVVDGGVRDVESIRSLSFPVYARFVGTESPVRRLKTTAYQVPISVRGVAVEPGDIVFGDGDGLVVVPKAEAQRVLRAAVELSKVEREVKSALELGASLNEAVKPLMEHKRKGGGTTD